MSAGLADVFASVFAVVVKALAMMRLSLPERENDAGLPGCWEVPVMLLGIEETTRGQRNNFIIYSGDLNHFNYYPRLFHL